ncbi:hypothetical protein LP420_09085 [Massilia sp. B-10]|nr:hypothetical protein LP420_09085 [Massilia sp. B-10]
MKQLVFALLAIAGCASAAEAPRFIYSPYKHLAQSAPYIVDGKRVIAPGALTWAFASGECGAKRWGEETAEQIATANVAAFNAHERGLSCIDRWAGRRLYLRDRRGHGSLHSQVRIAASDRLRF